MEKDKFLIWFVCFGNQLHKEMTFFSILSIINYTNYSGEIIVLSDTDQFTTNIDRVKVINVKNKYKAENKFNIYCIKPKITDFVDITSYKFCLYLDSDVLINYKNFDQLMNFWGDCDQILLIDNEGWKVHREVASVGSKILTKEEKVKHKDFEVCAGIFGVPGNQKGLEFLKTWDDLNMLDPEADDQGNLYAILLRNNFDVKYCEQVNKDKWKFENITHYHSKYKDIFWMHCQYILKEFIINPIFEGKYLMNKDVENLSNIWEFKDSVIYAENPRVVGLVQSTIFGTYIWWMTGGFEKINETGCFSSNQYYDCFKLKKYSEY